MIWPWRWRADPAQPLPCPCCGSFTMTEIGGYEICHVCNWQDSPVQSADPDLADSANQMSLNEAKRKWGNAQARNAGKRY